MTPRARSWSIVPRVIYRRPLSFTVLVVFMIDRSISMLARKTYDGREKWLYMIEFVEALLRRLERSRMAAAFRVGFVWYNEEADIVQADNKLYYPVVPYNYALDVFRKSVEQVYPEGYTSIASALKAASIIVDDYINNRALPSEKYTTLFLFSDGKETLLTDIDVIKAANYIKNTLENKLKKLNDRNRLSLATIGLGLDADRKLLREIASYLRKVQRQVLRDKGLLGYVDPPYHEKMFLDITAEGVITREWEEVARRFIERLSETATL